MKSKQRQIKILNATGGSWTSRKRAVKFLTQGRARYIDEQTIEMIEDDHRHLSALRSIEKQSEAIPMQSPTPMHVGYNYQGPENLRTFARYPVDGRDSFRQAA